METTETLALVKSEPAGGNALPEVYGIDADYYGDAPLVLPVYKINQKNGKLVHSLTEEEADVVDFVLVGITNTRILYNKNIGDKPVWFCRSLDMMNAQMNLEQMGNKELDDLRKKGAGFYCQKCPLQKWNKNGKPECSEVRNLLCFDYNNGNYFIFRGQRTSLKPIDNLINTFRASRLAPFTKLVHIKTELVKKDKKAWYLPRFILDKEPLPLHVVQNFRAEYDQYIKALRQKASEEPEEPSDYEFIPNGNGNGSADDAIEESGI